MMEPLSDWPSAVNGLVLLKLTTVLPKPKLPLQIDAELLDDVALDFGDRHLQHDLVAAAHDDRVDDLGAGADRVGRAGIDQPRRDVEGLLRFRLARHGSRQDHAVEPMPSTRTSESGRTCLIAARMPLRLRVTAMSRPAICLPSASKKNTLVCPISLPMT